MRHRVTVTIDAPPDRVWSVLEDVEHWPDFTESMISVARLDQGPLALGSRAKIRQPRMPATVWTVTELEPRHSFAWETRSPGVITVGGHAIEPGEGGGSVLGLTFDQTGAASGIVAALFGRRVRQYVEMEAEGLRRAAEGPSRGDAGPPPP